MPASMSVSGGKLYLGIEMNLPNEVVSVPLDGGPENIIAANLVGAWDPIACGSAVCWLSEVGPGEWGVFRSNPDAGAPDMIADSIGEPLTLLFDGRNFYGTSGAGGALWRIPSFSAPVNDGGANGLAMDDSCLYWSTHEGIFSLAKDVAEAQ
jgi:hypothetical protein